MDELPEDGGVKLRQVELDLRLQDTVVQLYWPQNEKFYTLLDLTFPRPVIDACRILELWSQHLIGAKVSVQPVQKIAAERWLWHIGLNTKASGLTNDLCDSKGAEKLFKKLALLIPLGVQRTERIQTKYSRLSLLSCPM